MKKVLLSILLLFVGVVGFGQCPTSPVVLNTQAEVDAFATNFMGCTIIDVNITISGNNITDLSGLSQIETITETLRVSDCPNLISLSGLNGIALEGEEAHLIIFNNPLLETLTPFTQNLGTTFFGISISDCPNLQSLDSFSGITSILDLSIDNNDSLMTLNGFENLVSCETLYINDNAGLTSLSALSNLNGNVEEITVQNNPLITNLYGFESVTSVVALGVSIGFNASLQSLEGLSNITTSSTISIVNNPLLGNLDALNIVDGLQYIEISGNQLLTDISGIENVETDIVEDIIILNNVNLSMCNINSFCNYFFNGGFGNVSNNATSCNSINEILVACGLNIGDNLLSELIIVYPNPTFDVINIVTENTVVQKVSLFSVSGKILSRTTSNQMDLSSYATGVYFITIETTQGTITKKIVKE